MFWESDGIRIGGWNLAMQASRLDSRRREGQRLAGGWDDGRMRDTPLVTVNKPSPGDFQEAGFLLIVCLVFCQYASAVIGGSGK